MPKKWPDLLLELVLDVFPSSFGVHLLVGINTKGFVQLVIANLLPEFVEHGLESRVPSLALSVVAKYWRLTVEQREMVAQRSFESVCALPEVFAVSNLQAWTQSHVRRWWWGFIVGFCLSGSTRKC